MNRSWIAKFICPTMVGTLVLAAWSSLQAAPLALVTLEGRRAGEGTTAWRSQIGGPGDASGPVKAGDRIEYRIRVQLNQPGTTNTQQSVSGPVVRTINGAQGTNDGMNSVHVNLRQAATDTIQVDFLRGNPNREIPDPEGGPSSFADDQLEFLLATSSSNTWRALQGFSGGTLTTRPGTSFHNLDNVRGQRPAGNFVGATAPITMASPPAPGVGYDNSMVGDAIVMTDGLLATLMPSWGVGTGTSGSGRINAGADPGAQTQFFVTDETQTTSADPIVGFQGLTLVGVPEPSTFVLAGLGLVGLVGVVRRRRAA